MSDERKRTAHHEAGHAVVGYVLGIDVASASIVPNQSHATLGHVSDLSDYEDMYANPERQVCMLYAGFAAGVRFSPATRHAERRQSCADDDQAESLLRAAGLTAGDDRQRLWKWTKALVAESCGEGAYRPRNAG